MSLRQMWQEMLDLQAKLTMLQSEIYAVKMSLQPESPERPKVDPEKMFGKIEPKVKFDVPPQDNIPKSNWTPRHEALFGDKNNTPDPLCGGESGSMGDIMAHFGVE
jgi:hypothetical protein